VKEKKSIYYMRLFAIILIVNSHINPSHVSNFKPFAFYGDLGNLGNMIFFFISSYVLTLGFDKYKRQKLRWLINREYYIISTIIIVRIFFKYLNGEDVNVLTMLIKLVNDINFISVMIGLSAIYPLFFLLKNKSRNFIFIVLLFLILIGYDFFDLTTRGLFIYTSIFLFGIIIAQSKTNFSFRFKLTCFLMSIIIFILTKKTFIASYHITSSISMLVKIPMIYFIFLLLESFDFSKIPSKINNGARELAKLSLFIYVTHFYFINYAYQINAKLCLLILFLFLIPVCYIENIILTPILSFGRRLIIK
jgi:hypothetical protein